MSLVLENHIRRFFLLLSVCAAVNELKADLMQNRPPEMVQAGRNESQFPELVDFENIVGWKVETSEGISAKLTLSDENVIYGNFAAKLVVDGAKKGTVTILPPSPMVLPKNFNSVNIWTKYLPYKYGGGLVPGFFVDLRDSRNQKFRVSLGRGDWGIWEILNTRVIAPDENRFNSVPAQKMGRPVYFENIRIEFNPQNAKPPFIFYFDSLCFYEENLKTLNFKFSPANLPKPMSSDTILPLCKKGVTNETSQVQNKYKFMCTDINETLVYTVTPTSGTLNDIRVAYNGKEFQPCHNGGIIFKFGNDLIKPDNNSVKIKNSSIKFVNGLLTTHWEIQHKSYKGNYRLAFQIKRKSLIVDVSTGTHDGIEVFLGYATPVPKAKLISVPYLHFENIDPQIISFENLFLSAFFDWWNSDSTCLYAKSGPSVDSRGLYYNGGAKYSQLTNGTYNKIRERIFVTVSSDFQEVLPGIPNPKSPYLHDYKSAVWRWVYGGPQNIDWIKQLHDYGVENYMLRFHADSMRGKEESYALRTHAAESIGDSLLINTGKELKEMGFGFALYSCYMNIEGVNKEFDFDILNRTTMGDTAAGFHKYRVKPLSFLELQSRLAPELHNRFGTTFSYLDVHAARAPWRDTDCDIRSPMPGMFRLDFLANAQAMLNDRIGHDGPVWSEGGMQWLYAGFVDSTYGYMGHEKSWDKANDLVDFDLLYLHPRMISIGMGDLSMYFKNAKYKSSANRLNPFLDRFISATIAYGHAAWQESPATFGLDGALKSYYLTNVVQSNYIGVKVEKIGYFDGSGIIDTSKAIQTDAFKRKQIYVLYQNGLEIWVNLNLENDNWRVKLAGREFIIPPGGFVAYKPNDLIACSACINGGPRLEYVKSSNYIYFDSRENILIQEGIGLSGGAVAIKVSRGNEVIITPLPSVKKLRINFDQILGKHTQTEEECHIYPYQNGVKMLKGDKEGFVSVDLEPNCSKYVVQIR